MEVWKAIPGYEGIYEISSEGRIKTLEHSIGNRTVPGIIRKPNNLKGYLCIALKNDGRTKVFRIHRLVAECFIGPAPTEYYQVNHIDGNKQNNHVDNLEWVLPKENTQHAIQTGLRRPYDEVRRKKVGESMRQVWQNPEYRENQRTQALKAWSDPEHHRLRSLAIKEGICRAKEVKQNG